MRSLMTEISSKLFGLSLLIFILAFVIPLLRGSPSPAEKNDTAVSESPEVHQKTIKETQPQQSSGAARDEGKQPPGAQSQGEPTPIQSQGRDESPRSAGAPALAPNDAPKAAASDQSHGEPTAAAPSPTNPPEAAVSPIGEKSTEPATPPIPTEENPPPQREPTTLLVLGEGYFPPGQVTPGANAQDVIDKIIPMIQSRSPDKIIVEGHSDKWLAPGASAAQAARTNKIISLQRANAIAMILEQKGIASNRIIVRGLGDAIQVASNLTREGRARNRRVEIKLLPAQQPPHEPSP